MAWPLRRNLAAFKTFAGEFNSFGENAMATQNGINPVLAFVLGAAVVGLIVLGYLYYQRTHRDVVKIDVPGFSGEISKDKGIDIEVGKDR
jgi:hypothetical protein